MTGRIGEIRDREIWLRCPECGDTQSDPTKAHFSINLDKFVFHCYRCNAGGRLTSRQMLSLLSQVDGDVHLDLMTDDCDDELELPALIPGAGSPRPSALDRFHYYDLERQINWDAFEMKDAKDNLVCGVHLRSGKQRFSFGDRGYGYHGAGPLLSCQTEPLVIVEGPYDVISESYVCTYGIISQFSLRGLSGHFVSLCPDGDIWQKEPLFWSFYKTVQGLLRSGNPVLTSIIILPEGKDPDEVEPGMEHVIAREELMPFLNAFIDQLP